MKELMIQVERAVRPVQVSGRRKDRMREELLAHLTSIYEEELRRRGDSGAALQAALERFGDPAQLTRALQESVTLPQRVDAGVERWFAWRAPESAARYTFRLGLLFFAASLVVGPTVSAVSFAVDGIGVDPGARLQLGMVFLLGASVDVFLLGLLYFKIRDALWGPPWAARSRWRAAAHAFLFGLVACGSFLIMPLLGAGTVDATIAVLPQACVFGLLAPLVAVLVALLDGRAEIRHTEWACLDIAE
jgi:hypothetical protein